VATYYESLCTSFFTRTYYDHNLGKNVTEVTKLNCSDNVCCSEKRRYCYNFERDEPELQLEYGLIGDKDCKKADRPKVDIGNATY
jgi:hypothetical protein